MIWWPSKTFCNKIEQQQLESEQRTELHLSIGPDVTREQCVYDQTVSQFLSIRIIASFFKDLLLKSEAELEALRNQQGDDDDEPPPWRYGPAQMWYDRLGLPEKPHRFDYGFKTNRFNIVCQFLEKIVFDVMILDQFNF